MPSPDLLRQAGAAYLTRLVHLRPDVLEPIAPRSLTELAARLEHPMSLTRALAKLPLPALEVAEALAALGPGAFHSSLIPLLGVEHEQAIRQEIARLTDLGLVLWGSLTMEPTLADSYEAPLRLGPPLETIIGRLTVPQLQDVVAAWGAPRSKQPRRAGMVSTLRGILSDPVRIAAAVQSRPAAFQEVLLHAAFDRPVPFSNWPTWRRPDEAPAFQQDLEWAQERMILVQLDYGTLTMPGPVALALRGSGWRARFTPEQPAGQWQAVAQERIDAEAAMAAASAHRLLGDLLRLIVRTPVKRRKDGAVGAVELRRLGKALGLPAEETAMLLGLAYAAGLLEREEKVTVSAEGRSWMQRDPAQAMAQVTLAWTNLPDTPAVQPDLSWSPAELDGILILRAAVFEELAARPGHAPVNESLVERLMWSHPTVLTRPLDGPVDGMPFTENEHGDVIASQASPSVEDFFTGGMPDENCDDCIPPDQRAARAIAALVKEATFLGIMAEGTLSPVGLALSDNADLGTLESALEKQLGAAKDEVVLQADLTATALGQPSGRLITSLDQMAEREGRSAATVWRFSPASIRKAMDAGRTADQILEEIASISQVEVPQPLAYLVRDVARSHGVLRGGSCVSYLRSEDASMLAQVVADRKLRRHELQQIAPSVLVSSTPIELLLDALRAAGYAPVQEASGGATLTAATDVHQQATPKTIEKLRDRAPAARAQHHAVDSGDLIARLLKAPNGEPYLIDLGGTVVDMRSLQEQRGEWDLLP